MKNLLATICAACLMMTGCSNEPPVEVQTERVLSGGETFAIAHEGTVSLSDTTTVRAQMSGNVLEKYFEDGTDVTEGQPLFKIGNKECETELLQAKAALAELMTTLAKEAAQKNPVGELQAEIAERQARIQELEDDLPAGMVYAPKSGRIDGESVHLGETVTENETILATIGKINPTAVCFEVTPEERQIISAADNLKVVLKFNDGTIYPHAGAIRIFNEDSTVETTFDNFEGRLLAGMTVQVELDSLKASNVLLAPEKAIHQREGGDYVFVVDSDKKAALKKISLGGKVGNKFIVNDGLKAGEEVVVEGFINLHEGTPLSVKNDK